MNDQALRLQIVELCASLFQRGYSCGSSGNVSVRLDDGGLLVTPTNSCLGRLDPARIARVDASGRHLSGDKPSKEVPLHLAMYRERPNDRAVVHLHSTYCVTVSCLADLDADDVLPPLTPYYVMRVRRCPLVPYFPPGDARLAEAVADKAKFVHAMLLANHGPVVSAPDLSGAVFIAEELEEAARIFLLSRGHVVRPLTLDQVETLKARFPG